MLISGTQEITSSTLFSSSYELSTRKLVMTGLLFIMPWNIELLHRLGLLALLFFFILFFFSFISDSYHRYKICMFVCACVCTYIHVYVCIYKDITNAKTASELLYKEVSSKSLFQSSPHMIKIKVFITEDITKSLCYGLFFAFSAACTWYLPSLA